MSTITPTSEVQSTSKPQDLNDRITTVWNAVHDLDGAVADLVGGLAALGDEDTPKGVRELAYDMLLDAEEVRYQFDHGDLFAQVEKLEALADTAAEDAEEMAS